MNADPAEWHSFGDQGLQPGAAGAGSLAQGGAAVQGRGTAGSHARRSPWLVIGASVLAMAVGLAVFVAVLVWPGGRDELVIAARTSASSAPEPSSRERTEALHAPAGSAEPVALLVDVEGAVRQPGLHHVAAGSRIGDAITAAGGYAEGADLAAAAEVLNLAEPLADGAKVRVPRVGETSAAVGVAATPGAAKEPETTDMIDLNHADQAGLESLPGIGPVTAGKIMAARESAPFASVDDLLGRDVVTASVMDKIRLLVTVTP
ncbi:MAG: competence protein ComEA [Chloroflexota bacterium]|jgi:competence protein ComEA|nr:competence protein ComEA [Chloroflexota bacterium]